MKVSSESIENSQVLLQIEVDDERLEKAKDSAYRHLASKVKVPGFRPGKVPRAVLERHVGEETILQEAIDRLMPQVYREALEQEEIDPIDQAQYELVTEQPLVAKFTVPIRPTIDLGEYTTLRVPREPVVVEPERIEEGLEALRHRYATLEPIERPIAWDDIVRADVDATVDGSPLLHDEDAEFQLVEGRTVSLPGFAEALLGHAKGDEFEFDLTVPDDAPDERMRGSQAHYKVHIKETKQEVLPKLDDAFAREVGEGFESLEALRSRVEDDLRTALEQEEEQRYRDQVLDDLVDRVQPPFPPAITEREVEHMVQDASGAGQPQRGKANSREGLERYLQQVGKSEEELRAELQPIAETRIRRSLVLSEVTEAEHIVVTDGDVDAEIERISAGAGDQADELRRLFSSEDAKENLRRSLKTKKTLDRLVEIASSDEAVRQEAAQASAPQDG